MSNRPSTPRPVVRSLGSCRRLRTVPGSCVHLLRASCHHPCYYYCPVVFRSWKWMGLLQRWNCDSPCNLVLWYHYLRFPSKLAQWCGAAKHEVALPAPPPRPHRTLFQLRSLQPHSDSHVDTTFLYLSWMLGGLWHRKVKSLTLKLHRAVRETARTGGRQTGFTIHLELTRLGPDLGPGKWAIPFPRTAARALPAPGLLGIQLFIGIQCFALNYRLADQHMITFQ